MSHAQKLYVNREDIPATIFLLDRKGFPFHTIKTNSSYHHSENVEFSPLFTLNRILATGTLVIVVLTLVLLIRRK